MTGLVQRRQGLSTDPQQSELDELLHHIRKLRWAGREQEAQDAQSELHRRMPTGSVLTIPSETD